MKSEFIRTLKIAALAISGAAILSCTNLDEVNDRLDSLESRIQALETQLPTLNNNVTALTQIANSGIINGIKPTEEGDGYVITTVDGETYTLRQGSIGNTPLMSIDEDGYWIVSYDNGANYERITVGGQPVAAAGMTPKFQVGAEGQWQISYDGGKVFEDVKDTEGNTVTAVGEGSDFFQDLTYADGILHITLADGQELDVTVVPDFSCVIAGVDYNTPEMFEYGATKHYNVDIKGVAEAIVSAPAGWTAVLEGTEPTAQLTVTAPEAETKISADTRTDVSILAVSSKGYSAITKLKVGLSAEPVPANPVARIQPLSDATTASSLSFTVTPNPDATSWKYMLLKADAAAPATYADFADATEQTGTQTLNLTATADGTALAGNTEYAIYVLPINTKGEEVTYGAIASAKATTAMPSYDTYYAMYEAGLDITIAGRTYNKETYGTATLVTAENSEITAIKTGEIAGTAVYFIEPDIQATFAVTSGIDRMLIIGNDPDRRSTLKVNNRISLNQGSDGVGGTFVCSNIHLDLTGFNNYHMYMTANGSYDYVGFSDCGFTLTNYAMFGGFNINRKFNEIVFDGCDFNLSGLTAQTTLLNPGSVAAYFGTISFTNNIVYSTDAEGKTDFRIFLGGSSSVEKIILRNNSFINIWHGSGSATPAYIGYKTLGTVDVQYNLVWTDKTFGNNFSLFRFGTDGNYPAGDICRDNIIYHPNTDKNIWLFFDSIDKVIEAGFEGAEEFVNLETDPFAGGEFNIGTETFIPGPEYSSYGAQRD